MFVSAERKDWAINEPSTFNPTWYSHKLHDTGIRYEISMYVCKEHIVLVNVPFQRCSYSVYIYCLKRYPKGAVRSQLVISEKAYIDWTVIERNIVLKAHF